MMEGTFIGGQLKAARKLRDVKTTKALEGLLNKPRFGAKVLGLIERDERPAQPHEIAWLADALELPETFFTDPPAATAEDGSRAVVEMLSAVKRLLEDQSKLLARQSIILERIERASGRGDDVADRIEQATQRADAVVHKLDASAERVGRALRGGTPRPKPKVSKPASKRTQKAAARDSP